MLTGIVDVSPQSVPLGWPVYPFGVDAKAVFQGAYCRLWTDTEVATRSDEHAFPKSLPALLWQPTDPDPRTHANIGGACPLLPRKRQLATEVRRVVKGRVEMWRGGCRLNISVAASFVLAVP